MATTSIGSLMIDVAMGVARVESDMGKIDKSLKAHVGQWEKAGETIKAAVAGWISFEALKRVNAFYESGVQMAGAMAEVSEKTGVAVEALSNLKYAAERNSVPWETLQKGLRKFSQELVKEGRGGESVLAALRTVADEFKGMPDGMEKTAKAMDMFGAKVGQDLIPLLNEGASGIDALMERNRALGGQMSTETAEAADRYEKAMHDVETAMSRVKLVMVTELAPWLSNIAEAFVAGAERGTLYEGVIKAIDAAMGHLSASSEEGQRSSLTRELADVQKQMDVITGKAKPAHMGEAVGNWISNTFGSSDEFGKLKARFSYLTTTIAEIDKRSEKLKKDAAAGLRTGPSDVATYNDKPMGSSQAKALEAFRKEAYTTAKKRDEITRKAQEQAKKDNDKLIAAAAKPMGSSQEKEIEKFRKEAYVTAKKRQAVLDDISRSTYSGQRALLQKQYAQQLKDLNGSEAEQAALKKAYADQDLAMQRAHSAQVLAEQERRGALITSVLEGFLGKNNAITKAYAIANAIMNTWQGVTQALADSSPPWSFIQAAAVLAQGMAAVQSITATTPGGGGGGGGLVASPGEKPTTSDVGGSTGSDLGSAEAEISKARSEPTHVTEIHFHGPVMGTDSYINNTLIPRINEAFRNRSLVAVMP